MAIAEMAATVAIASTALSIAAIVTETEGAAEEMLDELEEEEEESAYCVLMMRSLQKLYRVGEGRRIRGRGESDR